MRQVYLDNASTSYPKSPVNIPAIADYLEKAGGSPGRSGHQRARISEEYVDRARQKIGQFLNCSAYQNIAYTHNATYAINMAIKGSLKPGDHVITTCLDHNSVLRPLESLKRQGIISYTVIGLDQHGLLDLEQFRQAFQPHTALVVATHASNVFGIINPISEIINIAHQKGTKVLIDASQTAGLLDIDIDSWEVDYLAFTGHKSLLSLPGTGGLYVRDGQALTTIIEGGTGGNSLSLVQPASMPDKFEAGTCNYTGIVALGACVEFLQEQGRDKFLAHERALLEITTTALRRIDNVRLYDDQPATNKVPVLSFNIQNYPANAVSSILDEEHGIMSRPGLQCAPLAHKAAGTSPGGTVRLSFGWSNTEEECEYVIRAIKQIAAHSAGK